MNERIRIVHNPDKETGSGLAAVAAQSDTQQGEEHPHRSLFSISLEEEQALIEQGDTAKLVEAHMRAASNLAYKKFSGIARRHGVSLADLESEAFATVAKCAARYAAKSDRDRNVPFYAYYKNAVIGACSKFLQENKGAVPLTQHGRNTRNKMIHLAEERGGTLANISEAEVPLMAKFLGARPETIRAILAQGRSADISLDESLGDDEGIQRHEVLASGALHDSSSPYHTDPETLMIRAEEANERNERLRVGNEFGNKLDDLLAHLPKESSQVIRFRYIYPSRLERPWKEPAPYERFCKFDDEGNRVGGRTRESGLALSPHEAAAHEAIGLAILREFSNEDYSRAHYYEVVRDLPVDTLERDITLIISDPLEKRIAEYTLLKTREINSNEGYKPTIQPMLSPGGLATRNHKALEGRAGHSLTKDQARGIILGVIESVSRRIAEHEGLLLEQQKTNE